MKKLFLAGLAFGALIAPALAADMPLKAPVYATAPPPEMNYNWTGFYVGGNAGGAWGSDRVTTTQFAPVPPFLAIDATAVSAAESASKNPRGFTGGLQAGYNLQTGHVVWGIEAGFDYLDLRGSNAGTFPFPSTLPGGPIGPPTLFFSTTTSASTNWLFTARPRLGWAAANWLLYVTGGLAVGNEKFSQTVPLLATFVENAAFSTTRIGWTVGAGLEYALNQNWSIRGEYLFVDLGTVGTTGTIAPFFAGFSTASSVHLAENIVRFGVNYKFD